MSVPLQGRARRGGAGYPAGLPLPEPFWFYEHERTAKGWKIKSGGADVEELAGLKFKVTVTRLPEPPLPADAPPTLDRLKGKSPMAGMMTITGLTEAHTLFIDDKEIMTATAKEWAAGVRITSGVWGGLTERERRPLQFAWVQEARRDRDRAVLAAGAAGYTTAAIGRSLGLSRISVTRIVHQGARPGLDRSEPQTPPLDDDKRDFGGGVP